ncbi:HEAT repeat domain-containing protein [Streptomyces ficellus]|nr:HEAT repeat domain-containing protein [Streptomyces ficellus]
MAHSVDAAAADLIGDQSKAFPGALLRLHADGGPEADAVIMRFVQRMSNLAELEDDLYAMEHHGLAVRVAAELNPDRDVEPFLSLLEPRPPSSRLARKIMSSWAAVAHHDTFPGASWGFTRLRRLDPPPVPRYTARLQENSGIIRSCAAMALGDTADLAALEPLAHALDDPSPDVRFNAVMSVRRLRHAGAARVLDGHPAESGLVKALSDRKLRIRKSAAQALKLLDRSDLVHRAAATTDASTAKMLRQTLERDVDPLPRIWPGDNTTL